jgi:hypothetical protein
MLSSFTSASAHVIAASAQPDYLQQELPNSGTDEKIRAAASCHAYDVKEAAGVRLIHEPLGYAP